MQLPVATLSGLYVLASLGALAAPLPRTVETNVPDLGSNPLHAFDKRGGLLDAVPGILTLVGGIIDGLLNATEASVASIGSLLLVEQPSESALKSYGMSPSSTDSTQVYLVPSNNTRLGPTQVGLPVTLHVPLFSTTGMLDMCLTYNSSAANRSSLLAQPCGNNTTECSSQLFRYDLRTGAIVPILNASQVESSINPEMGMPSNTSNINNTWVVERKTEDASNGTPLSSTDVTSKGFAAQWNIALVFTPAAPAVPDAAGNEWTTASQAPQTPVTDAYEATQNANAATSSTNPSSSAAPSFEIIFSPSSSDQPVDSIALLDPDLQDEESEMEAEEEQGMGHDSAADSSSPSMAVGAPPSEEPCEDEDEEEYRP